MVLLQVLEKRESDGQPGRHYDLCGALRQFLAQNSRTMADVFEGLYPKVVIAPLALATILDAHTRKGERECLCALVGMLNDDGSLSVSDAVVNFEVEGMPVKGHHETFILARQRINPRELLLGWATTAGGNLTINSLHDIGTWARSDTKTSRFIPQRRFPAPISIVVAPPTPTSDLSIVCEVRGPNNAIKNVPIEYVPCFLSEFDSAVDSSIDVGRTILDRIDEVLEIAREAKQKKDVALGRQLLNLVSLSGIDVDEYNEVDKEEAALFEWIKNIAQLQLQLNLKRQTAA